MRKKILIIGSLNVDIVIEMEHMPVIGETVLGTGLRYVPGGKGANQACAAARLGGDVKMLGCIGRDEFGEKQKKSLSDNGVDIRDLKVSSMFGTGTASIYVDKDGNNSIVVVPAANQECDIEYLQKNDMSIQECDYVILQMEIPYDSIRYAIKRAKELGKIVILNPAPAPECISDEMLKDVDYITPNETELMRLSGKTGIDMDGFIEGAHKLLLRGVKNVLVTLGEKGAMLVNKEKAFVYPTRKVVPVDTTAAGDCFNGAFAVALSEGKDLGKAVCFANAASSVAVTRSGAQTSLPEREEADEAFMTM
ncbi:ribokinase [Clostridium sp. AN503]|uniref:ribokinase n=1 Tax=Clostridium sp. AN503 TaxID=3160598 RepID=UPI00345B3B32